MGTLDSLYAAIDECPEDWDTYIVLADWYEEHGVDHVAECLRWQAKEQRRAYKFLNNQYTWTPSASCTLKSEIPGALWEHLPGTSGDGVNKIYFTRRQAQSALYAAYAMAKAFGWGGELT